MDDKISGGNFKKKQGICKASKSLKNLVIIVVIFTTYDHSVITHPQPENESSIPLLEDFG